MGVRTVVVARVVTLLSAVIAVVVGLWGAFGSPSDGWRSLGLAVIGPLLVGVLVIAYADHRSPAMPSSGAGDEPGRR